MEFLSSPIHNYSFETFDDGFFELPKDLDFDMNDEFKDDVIFALDKEDDLNDGLYGVWNTRQPWNSNNNTPLFNSNLHLDLIGGDLESAIMVNPNIVIPNGSHFEEEKLQSASNNEINGDISANMNKCEEGAINDNFLNKLVVTDDETPLKVRKDENGYVSLKENIMMTDTSAKTYRPKTGGGLRVLKPAAVVEVHSNKTKVVWQLGSSKNDNNTLKDELIPINGYHHKNRFYPKPAFSYSCLIAMALKNSKQGCLPVAEIYNFMCNHFPYFKTAPNGWKNSVRHNLSLNKCFEKIEKPVGSVHRKGCLWALNPNKAAKLQEEVLKSAKKDAVAIKKAMEYPEHLELLERGELQCKFDMNEGLGDEDEDVDTAEEDETEIEDPVKSEEETTVDDSYEEENTKLGQSKPLGLPKADGKLYERGIDVIDDDKLFENDIKKTRRYFTQVRTSPCTTSATIETEIDHYDINNYLKLENDTASKLGSSRKTPLRFIKRLSSNTTKMKQIKFKSWD